MLIVGALVADYTSRVSAVMMHSRRLCGFDQLMACLYPTKAYVAGGIMLFMAVDAFLLACTYLTTAAELLAPAFDETISVNDFQTIRTKPPSYYIALLSVSISMLPFLFTESFYLSHPCAAVVSNVIVVLVVGLFIFKSVGDYGDDPPVMKTRASLVKCKRFSEQAKSLFIFTRVSTSTCKTTSNGGTELTTLPVLSWSW